MPSVRGRRKARSQKNVLESEQEQALRKSLSVIQPTADNPTSLIGRSGTKSLLKVGKLKPTLSTKENSPMKTRQSRRKALLSSQETNDKSSTPFGNDTKNTENIKLKQQTLEKYSEKLLGKLQETDFVIQVEKQKEHLDHPDNSLSGISIPSESSGYFSDFLEKPEDSLKADVSVTTSEAADVVVSKSDTVGANEELQDDLSTSLPQDLYDILCGEKVPESYWKALAEQRQLALEETLRENVLLQDQLEVLEAENSRLKLLVNEAEKLAQIVQDVF